MNFTNLTLVLAGLVMSNFSLASTTVKIHAPVAEFYTCTEHWDGQFSSVGDALGTDCVIQEFVKTDDRMFMASFKGDGHNNEDWYGYGKNVLAPCDCTVDRVHINDVVNQPGIMNPGRSGSITFKRTDGTKVLIAHITDASVAVGDTVKAGDVVAKVGNNGYSRNPHLHIAAWKGEQALQIRFDQKTIDLKSRSESEK